MKLMFWKRGTGAAEEAEDAPADLSGNSKPHEPLDFMAAQQDIDGRDPESSAPDMADLATPAEPGLAARMRLRLIALTGYFRKTPAFRADEDLAPDMPGDMEEPEAVTDMEPEPEVPAKPGLGMRIKAQLVALTLRFRKTPAADDEGRLDDEAGESPALEAPARPGLLMRIKAGYAAFTREFKASAAPAAETDQETDSRNRPEAEPGDELPLPEEEAAAEPVRSRRWLVIGGSAVMAALLLFSYGITNWPVFKEQQKRWGTRHDITSISSRPLDSESEGSQAYAPARSPAEVEALRKENSELQSRIEALKNMPPQPQPYALPAGQAGEGSAPTSSVSVEITVDTKDPKAAAMSLKEAIEAMNAGSGDNGKKPAK